MAGNPNPMKAILGFIFAGLFSQGALASTGPVQQIVASDIKKVTHYQGYASVFLNDGCVVVGKKMPGDGVVRYRYKGKLCVEGENIEAPALPFVIPPQFRD